MAGVVALSLALASLAARSPRALAVPGVAATGDPVEPVRAARGEGDTDDNHGGGWAKGPELKPRECTQSAVHCLRCPPGRGGVAIGEAATCPWTAAGVALTVRHVATVPGVAHCTEGGSRLVTLNRKKRKRWRHDSRHPAMRPTARHPPQEAYTVAVPRGCIHFVRAHPVVWAEPPPDTPDAPAVELLWGTGTVHPEPNGSLHLPLRPLSKRAAAEHRKAVVAERPAELLVVMSSMVFFLRKYQHYVLDQLVGLAPFVELLRASPHIRVLAHPAFTAALVRAGLAPSQLVDVALTRKAAAVCTDRLHLAVFRQAVGGFQLGLRNSGLVGYFGATLVPRMFPGPVGPPAVVHAARRFAAARNGKPLLSRAVSNSDDVTATIRREVAAAGIAGLDAVEFSIEAHPDFASIDRQVALFRRARLVIGAHGGAFANVMFSPMARCATAVFEFTGDRDSNAYHHELPLKKQHLYKSYAYGHLMRLVNHTIGVYTRASSAGDLCSIPIEDVEAWIRPELVRLKREHGAAG